VGRRGSFFQTPSTMNLISYLPGYSLRFKVNMPLSDVLSSFLCSNTYSKIITLRSENIAMIMYTWISSFQYKNIIMQELHIVPVDIQHLTWWVAEIDFVFIAWKRNQAMPFGSKYALVLARTGQYRLVNLILIELSKSIPHLLTISPKIQHDYVL